MNWREALEAHLDAIYVCGRIARSEDIPPGRTLSSGIGLQESWSREYQFLQDAVPFAWTKDTVTACMHASKSVPMGSYYGGNENERLMSREKFVGCSADTLRFVIAAATWLKQKVVQVTEGEGHRSRRREFERATKRKPSPIKVVHLRRLLATEKTEVPSEGAAKREFSCQWVVEGHWRHQVCGPNRENRRLQFIMPYVKGPDDKPLRTHEKKIMVVDR